LNKRIMCIATIVTIALLVWVPGAGTALAGGGPTSGTYHVHYAGKSANAGWSTCPDGPAGPDEVCTDTYISVAQEMYREDGTRFPSKTLSLYEVRYMVDDQGNWISVSDTSGYGDASLTINKKLTSASASATVPLTICTVDGDGNYTCVEGGSVMVSGLWTGVGDLERSHGVYHNLSTGFTLNSHWKATYRNATATGQVNGVDLGTSLYAALNDSKSGDVWIYHGGY
jgi:hypothetical protein